MLILILLTACGDDESPVGPPSVATINVVSGDAQTGTVGTALSILTITALDAGGSPIEGTTISWTVVSGGGSLASASTSTNASGQATNTWTLGTTAGAQSVRASAGSGSATFSATAEPGPAANVTVTPGTETLYALDETTQLAASLADQYGNPLTGGSFDWESDDEDVATVDNGLVTAVGNGTATITASSGGAEGTATITVDQEADVVTVDPTELTLAIGADGVVMAAAEDANGHPVTDQVFAWVADDPGLVDLVANGDGSEVTITGVAVGMTTVTAFAGLLGAEVAVEVIPGDFNPQEDVELAGNVTFQTVNIPAGVTVTAGDDLTLMAVGEITIEGDVMGDCVSLTVEAGTDLHLMGDIDNACDSDPLGEEPLQLLASGMIDINGSNVVSSGDVLISNDPADLQAVPAGPSPTFFGAAAAQNHDCRYERYKQSWLPEKAPDDTPGSPIGITCAGTATWVGGNQISAQEGGDGTPDLLMNPATGNPGRRGGDVGIRSIDGDIVFMDQLIDGVRGLSLGSGSGGAGGRAEVAFLNVSEDGTGTGGPGGDAGDLVIEAENGNIVIQGVPGQGGLSIVYGDGGSGGDADVEGGPGEDAQGAVPAKAGGSATATGGAGGDAGFGQIFAQGGVVDDLLNITQDGGNGGWGGNATAIGGEGGWGGEMERDGAPGGDIKPTGGNGGNSLSALTLPGPPSGFPPRYVSGFPPLGAIGSGGDGGDARWEKGWGGFGYSDPCVEPFGPGGDGGDGGDPDGGAGLGGSGLFDGADGMETAEDGAGDGGDGGNGQAPGDGGLGDFLYNMFFPDAFRDGNDGFGCTAELITKYLDHLGIINTGGLVPPHTEILDLLDGAGQPSGSMMVVADGPFGQTFVGDGPPRFGWGPAGSWIFDLSTAEMGGSFWDILEMNICILNASISPSAPVLVEQLDGENNVIATETFSESTARDCRLITIVQGGASLGNGGAPAAQNGAAERVRVRGGSSADIGGPQDAGIEFRGPGGPS